jgi:hypothetical protein
LDVHDVSDVRQIEIHTAEPLVPGPSHLEVEISIAELKKYKSPGSDQILAELYQAGGETLVSVNHKLVTYKILSDVLLSQLSPYVDEIIGEHQCRFRRNRSTTDEIFCICQILETSGCTVRQYISHL